MVHTASLQAGGTTEGARGAHLEAVPLDGWLPWQRQKTHPRTVFSTKVQQVSVHVAYLKTAG